MRAAVAAFLGPFLIATPLTQLLAQTGQQGPSVAQSEETSVPIPVPTFTFQTSERSLSLSWVPSVERNSPAALIWAAGAINSTAASEPLLLAAPAELPTAKTVVLVVVGVIVAIGLAILIYCNPGGNTRCG